MPDDDKPTTARGPAAISGCGDLPVPMSVARFVVEMDPIMTESDWLQLGRPLLTIRYATGGIGGSPDYVYCQTITPACGRLAAHLLCPSNTTAIEAGVHIGGESLWKPVNYRQFLTGDAAVSYVRRCGGAINRRLDWSYSLTAENAQRYLGPDNVIRPDPQFTADVPPTAAKPKPRTGKPRKLRKPDRDDAPAAGGPTPPGEMPVCPNPHCAPPGYFDRSPDPQPSPPETDPCKTPPSESTPTTETPPGTPSSPPEREESSPPSTPPEPSS